MPSHVRTILFSPTDDFALDKIISNAKRFVPYEIIKRLKTANQIKILHQLPDGLSPKVKKKGQVHIVFEESFDAKSIENGSSLLYPFMKWNW
ncbi:hypothetical protein BH20BAC1_BH20BAC1_25890 [soil metagenome]